MEYLLGAIALIAVALKYVGVIYNKKQYELQKSEKEEKKKETVPEKITPPQSHPEPISKTLSPYIAHPYPMQENFTGRDEERGVLTEWFEEGEKPMLAVIAIGGMGKSSLAWKWVQDDVLTVAAPFMGPKADKAPDGVIWWSFYDRDSGFDSFISRSLEYASGGKVDPQKIQSIWDRMNSLYQILHERRFLLVLDGVERLLRHYARLDAPYINDKEPDESGSQDFRACADPHVCNFLGWLADKNIKSRTLLTSRLFPLELEGLEGCQKKELKDFSLDDTHKFFQRQGLDWTRAEVDQVCTPYGFLPLYLRLLTGMIVHDPLEPGELRPDPKKIIPKLTHELKPGRHQILEVAYDSLKPEQREFLSRIAAFRSPMDYKAVQIISSTEEKEATRDTLLALIGRGLLLFDEEERIYDLHPIVRSYSYDRLKDKEGTHTKLRDYFSAVLQPEEIKSLDDLNPVIELYHHTLRAGDYDKAFDLFYERLNKLLYYIFGAYQLRIELLLGLFPDGEDKLPRLKNKSDQAWTLAALGNSYSCSGELQRSVFIKKNALKLSEDLEEKENQAIDLGNLAIGQMALGELDEAETNIQRGIRICREINDKFWEEVDREQLGRLLAYKGDWSGADKIFKIVYEIFEELKKTCEVKVLLQWQGINWAYRSLMVQMQGDFPKALEARPGRRGN